jgi:uncharacterized protein
MKIIQITGAALLVLAVGALAGVGRLEAAGGASDDAQEGITVTGTGELRSTPNRANLSFSVHAEGSTAAGALAAGNAKLRRLIDALKGAGVDQEQLKTEYLGVNPRYDGGKTPSNGYTADASVSVTGQSLERASRLVDLGMSAGADSVSGPSLSIADRDAQYRRALERAFDDARAKAEALAAAAGVSLGEVTAVVEGAQYGGPVLEMAAARAALEAKTPIEPGSEKIAASVTVTFAIS